MGHYEIMFLMHNREPASERPAEGEEAPEERPAAPSPEEVAAHLVDRAGGSIDKSVVWANRKLAYPIAGNQTGTYVLAYVSGEGEFNGKLNREVHLSDRCLRHLVIKVDAVPDGDLEPLSEPGARARPEGEAPVREPRIWEQLDYKHVFALRRMVTSQGKLFSRTRSGLEAKNQRKLRRAVHRARNLALLPFVAR